MDNLKIGDVVTYESTGEIGLVILVEPSGADDDGCWELTASVKWFSDNDITREDANDPDGVYVIAKGSAL